MEENIQIIDNVLLTLDNINIPGRITLNAPIYNQIIACINSLAQLKENLQEKPEDEHEEDQTE